LKTLFSLLDFKVFEMYYVQFVKCPYNAIRLLMVILAILLYYVERKRFEEWRRKGL